VNWLMLDKFTSEFLDAMEAYKKQENWSPYFEPSMPSELIRLARLGLWADSHQGVIDAALKIACDPAHDHFYDNRYHNARMSAPWQQIVKD
jgi:hypothetical protein